MRQNINKIKTKTYQILIAYPTKWGANAAGTAFTATLLARVLIPGYDWSPESAIEIASYSYGIGHVLGIIWGAFTTKESSENHLEQIEMNIQETNKEVGRLNKKVEQINGNVNQLLGTAFERHAAKITRRRAKQMLNLSSPKIIHLANDTNRNAAIQIADQAETEGLLHENEAEDLENIDLIILDQETGIYAAGEISITLDADDAAKAHRRAALLSTATGKQATPILAGAVALNECLDEAQRLNVTIIIIPDTSTQETKSSN